MKIQMQWILAAGTAVLAAIITGTAIAQAARQHSLDPLWTVGWLPAVLVAVYPAVTGHRRARKPCLGRLRRSKQAAPPAAG